MGVFQTMTTSKALRNLINSEELTFIMESHNGLSARIAEKAGFPALWASGLSMSAQMGRRDNNELSWSQVVDIVATIAESASLPVLVDGDSGFGDFNIARRFVGKLSQAGAAGVCLEDKLYPKQNSFLESESQHLATIDDFCGKLKAIKDAQTDENFVLVARTEALITGHTMAEAIRRADSYIDAGADALFIHSKKADASQIITFVKNWGYKAPLIIAPTTYHKTPSQVFEEIGISAVIWANHSLRAAIWNMEIVANELYRTKNLSAVSERITSLANVFELQNISELFDAERKYQCPLSHNKMIADNLSKKQKRLSV
jgi:phosphoenolpyruvate phosphomutase